jgi:AraC-like DNA-binding protein
MKKISDNTEGKITLLAIVFDSVFNPKSDFNQNFKLETGMTPLE